MTASFALDTLPGSPWAVINRKAATINIITENPANTGHIRLIIFDITTGRSPEYVVGSGTKVAARIRAGRANSKDAVTDVINFLFIFYILKLLFIKLPAPLKALLIKLIDLLIKNFPITIAKFHHGNL
ncbi:MAG: hypothetical protein A3C58_00230 [Candidatus Staskawiczbacteria bacterium RIFCSPHIGHO2_02_FULL_34_10]|uniref:Uncharacterized protein n=2 Tax=Candidatus Staskawicziibacteriota TaxID=1817916 RepID=A0A1G2HL73_9BACT|nr:MAG: hypothetical protein A2639_02420 [Candidatus Staskawiczbacteria bacterium RIFCSPHIGHO2_01_FULL_34_27]OGZ67206.1 MAG: hypothetical protein A3C58_00230 [Candidatus Staskawiczbacteria bacterium RIFCSPHIGHO2_02_FULL_34_10]